MGQMTDCRGHIIMGVKRQYQRESAHGRNQFPVQLQFFIRNG